MRISGQYSRFEKITHHVWTDEPSDKGVWTHLKMEADFVSHSQPVWIDRFNPDARRMAVEEIKKRAKSEGLWTQIMIFPEVCLVVLFVSICLFSLFVCVSVSLFVCLSVSLSLIQFKVKAKYCLSLK